LLLLALAGSPSVYATTEPYGEVGRFGGFDASGTEPGKFVSPVGFAVDPSDPATSDHNAVYVLDRTVAKVGLGELQYRLQKLSSSGVALGSVTLPFQTFSDTENYTDAHPMIALTVDSAKHRVYALVEGIVEDGEGNYVPVVQRLVAWSTEPTAGKELVKAPGFATEDPLTKAALIAGQSILEPASATEDLYAPEGLTIDPANHDVVIEAQKGVSPGPFGGPTILQRIGTEGTTKEKLDGAPWIADTTIAPEQQQADGLFTANNGSFGIDLYQTWGRISRLADVKPNFGAPEASLIAPDTSAGKNSDQAASIDSPATINKNSNHGGQFGAADFGATTAGSPITQLTNNLYAARYARKLGGVEPSDPQGEVAPWNNGGGSIALFWKQGEAPGKYIGNAGVRLFTATGTVVTTIGGQAQGKPCNLDYSELGLAAGANGSLFVFVQLNETNGNSDDQVIEFAPGGAGACPVPAGEVTVNGVEASSVTVNQKVPVKFNAVSIKRAGGVPYEFDWNFEGKKTEGTAGTNDGFDLGAKIEAPGFKWPKPEEEHTYQKAGTYEASVRMIGDYGTSLFPIKVKVEPSEPAVASFTAPGSVVAGRSATFDGSTSKATPGSAVANYRWEFGDGSPATESTGPQKSHTFANVGTFKVKLKITDEVGETAEVMHEVTVATPPPEEKHEEKGQPKSEEKTTTTPIVTPPPVSVTPLVKPVVKPLTTAQKLAKALKACKKIKSKKQRASCEKQAKKKYATKAKVKKKSAKKK
jgi:PKD repeat protein